MDAEADFAIAKPPHLEIKPALGVALVVGPLGVAGSPDTIMVVAAFDHLVHVAGVEVAAEEDAGLAGFAEFETSSLRNGLRCRCGWLGFVVFHMRL